MNEVRDTRWSVRMNLEHRKTILTVEVVAKDFETAKDVAIKEVGGISRSDVFAWTIRRIDS